MTCQSLPRSVASSLSSWKNFAAGGIKDEQIRFLSAPGTHRYMTYQELAAKLGADILEKYPVYQHNAYENTVFVGNTSNGTPVYINREFLSCDLRLGIGSIIPHHSAGFGAGAKIILAGHCGDADGGPSPHSHADRSARRDG